MITAVAFVPSTPLLVPAVASGAAGELDEVRAASIDALRVALTTSPARLVVLGAGRETRELDSGTGSLRGFGVPVDVPLDPAVPGVATLPLSLTVGAWLLAQVGWPGDRAALELDPSADDLAEVGVALRVDPVRTALLVVADGSASRSERAPASFHPGAEAFDASVAAALAAGDPMALAALDRATASEVGSAGWPAWHVAAAAAVAAAGGAAYDANVTVDAAPYGVGYLVATWTRRD